MVPERTWAGPAVWAALLVMGAGCGDIGAAPDLDAGGGGDADGVSAGDGYHRITVSQPHGEDELWIYAASPGAAGPHPVVVFAHGQGASNLVNCQSDGRPEHADVAPSVAVADQLSSEGYVAVAVFYRHMGDVAPATGALEYRDQEVLDTRSLLAAAQWARARHGEGGREVAFIGTSMGTYPAFYAGTADDAWRDLQQGLDVRLVVIAGMFLNHVANARQNLHEELTASADEAKVQGILGASSGLGPLRAGSLDMPEIRRADLEEGAALRAALEQSLTPRAIELYRELLFLPPEELGLAECAGVSSRAFCEQDCAVAVIARAFEGRTEPVVLDDWLLADAIALGTSWDPSTPIDLSAEPADSALALARDLSPVYRDHQTVVPRVLPLLSASDHTFAEQGQAAADVLRELLVDTLGVTEVESVPTIDEDGQGPCGHGDYFLPSRPSCGWEATRTALAEAFAAE